MMVVPQTSISFSFSGSPVAANVIGLIAKSEYTGLPFVYVNPTWSRLEHAGHHPAVPITQTLSVLEYEKSFQFRRYHSLEAQNQALIR